LHFERAYKHIHSKKCWVVLILGQILTNPIVGLKNAIYIFNSTAGFVHI